jgi:Spy/CpxP family protein refolding chaperone
MKKSTRLMLIMTFAFLWGFAARASAQVGYSVNDQISRMKEELKLDQDQSRKVAILLIKMDEQKTADEEKYADNQDKLRSAAMERRKKLGEDLKSILTAEQYEKFEKMRFRPDSGNRTARQMEELTQRLTLSDEQVTKLQAVFDKYNPQMQELFGSLRGGPGESGGDRTAMRDKMREIRASMDQEIETFLTADQLKEYQAYQEEMRNRRGPSGQGGPGGQRGE